MKRQRKSLDRFSLITQASQLELEDRLANLTNQKESKSGGREVVEEEEEEEEANFPFKRVTFGVNIANFSE